VVAHRAASAGRDAMSQQIAYFVSLLINILTFAMIGRALLSWVDPGGRWPISRVLYDVTEPFVAPIRRVIPPMGMIDISFIVAILLLQFLGRLLNQALTG
jgi:YggT family protein